MAQNAIQAQPPLEFIPPQMTDWLVGAVGAALPYFLKTKTSLATVEAHNVERLVELYRDFQEGKVRFLMAFRHPSSTDPLVFLHLLGREVPREAARMGVHLKRRPHAYFLYDRGVPLWAGKMVGWALPRLGGISLQRGKLDRASLKTTRDKFANGDQPLMVAPEGATNGLNEVVSPLEPGIAQMAFWCLEDLREKGCSEKVVIIPIGLKYEYLEPPWEALEQTLGELEQHCGLKPDASLDRYGRLRRLGEQLLGLLEQYYTRFYQQTLEPAADLSGRLRNLLETSLRVSEQFFNLQPKGSLSDRCRRIEQAGWDRIYREDLKEGSISPVERGLADHVAGEAHLRMWHMRLVESFVAVTGTYVQENPTAERFAEMVSLIYHTVLRLEGTASRPMALGKQRAVVTVLEPISVDAFWEKYQTGRPAAREAVTELTKDLQEALERSANAAKALDPANSDNAVPAVG